MAHVKQCRHHAQPEPEAGSSHAQALPDTTVNQDHPYSASHFSSSSLLPGNVK